MEKKKITKRYIPQNRPMSSYVSRTRIHEDDTEVVLVSDVRARLEYFEQNYPKEFFMRIKRLLREMIGDE